MRGVLMDQERRGRQRAVIYGGSHRPEAIFIMPGTITGIFNATQCTELLASVPEVRALPLGAANVVVAAELSSGRCFTNRYPGEQFAFPGHFELPRRQSAAPGD